MKKVKTVLVISFLGSPEVARLLNHYKYLVFTTICHPDPDLKKTTQTHVIVFYHRKKVSVYIFL